jgi:hypothetical protein
LFWDGTYPVDFTETPIFDSLARIRAGGVPRENVFALCEMWEFHLKDVYNKAPDKQTNYEPINEFLLKARREYWND